MMSANAENTESETPLQFLCLYWFWSSAPLLSLCKVAFGRLSKFDETPLLPASRGPRRQSHRSPAPHEHFGGPTSRRVPSTPSCFRTLESVCRSNKHLPATRHHPLRGSVSSFASKARPSEPQQSLACSINHGDPRLHSCPSAMWSPRPLQRQWLQLHVRLSCCTNIEERQTSS